MAPFCLKEEEILASWNYLQMRITCKKSACYMCDSTCSRRIVQNAKTF